MNEWGTPDWRDHTAYGETSEWTPTRWDWEAIRRRSDYRIAALELLEFLNVPILTAHGDKSLVEKWNAFVRRWGYRKALDPRIAEHPEEDLLRSGFSKTTNSVIYMTGSKSSEAGVSAMHPQIGEVAILFDLHKPIDVQLKQAREVLKKQRAERGITQERYRIDLDCLRVLDAHAEGAFSTPSRVASTLWPGLQKTTQSANDKLEQAQRWQGSF